MTRVKSFEIHVLVAKYPHFPSESSVWLLKNRLFIVESVDFPYGCSIGFPWIFPGFPWISHGFPMGFPWIFHG